MATKRVLLLGKTGVGKSTFGNFLLNRDGFKSEVGCGSITGEPAKEDFSFDSQLFCVVDTPGLCDATDVMSDEEGLKMIAQGIQMAAGEDGSGVDAILLVLNAGGRFSKDEQRMMEYFEAESGEFWSHVTLILSNANKLGSSLEEQERKFQDVLENPRTSKSYKEMIKKVGRRYVLVESVERSPAYRNERVREVIRNVTTVVQENHGKRYTTELFQEVQKCGSEEKAVEIVTQKVEHTVQQSSDDECFPANAIIFTQDGPKEMKSLRPGDSVLTLTNKGQKVFTEVITFLHYHPDHDGSYIVLKSESGRSLTVSPNHLIYTTCAEDGEMKQDKLEIEATYAGILKGGDKIIFVSQDKIETVSIESVRHVRSYGLYAPLTRSGTIVVDGVLASCYANFPNQRVAHTALAPLRLQSRFVKASIPKGVHPYARFLHSVVQRFAPKYLECPEDC